MIRALCFLGITWIMGTAWGQAATLYYEDFSTSTFGTTGQWRARHSDTAQAFGGVYGSGITTGTAGPMGTNNRYAYIQHIPAAQTQPVSTTEAQTTQWLLYSPNRMSAGNIAPSLYQGGSLNATWSIGSAGAIVDYYFTIQIGSQWYAANQKRVTTDAIQNGVAPLNLLNTGWYQLNFTEGTTLNLNTSTTLDASTLFANDAEITGVGFYLANMTGNQTNSNWRTVRIDGITISGQAVPEPSKSLLLMIAGGSLFMFVRKR